MPLISLATPQETLDSEKVLEIRRAKWKKRLEEPARKMLKVSHGKNRAGDESEVSSGGQVLELRRIMGFGRTLIVCFFFTHFKIFKCFIIYPN